MPRPPDSPAADTPLPTAAAATPHVLTPAPAVDSVDIACAESFFEQLAADPRFAPFVPAGEARLEEAVRQASYVRNVLRGDGT